MFEFMMCKPLFWNIHGLGTSRRRLRKLVKRKKLNFIMLAESFTNESNMDALKNTLQLRDYFSNQSNGGKIWLLWGNRLQVSVLNCSSQHVTSLYENKQFYVSVVYANSIIKNAGSFGCFYNRIYQWMLLGYAWVILILFEVTKRGVGEDLV